jgi:hypothetical protein
MNEEEEITSPVSSNDNDLFNNAVLDEEVMFDC